MDPQGNVTETLSNTMWLNQPSPTPYQRLSPTSGRQDGRDLIVHQQVSMGYQVADSILWHEKQSPQHSPDTNHPLHPNGGSSRGNSPTSQQPISAYHQPNSGGLKRRLNDANHHVNDLDRKHIRRDGSTGSNSSQIWSTSQVEEYAQTLVAEIDGSLATLTSNDIAIATYGISEALLAFPSLTTFKQEAPSPENHVNNPNSNLNHVSQRSLNGPHQSSANINLPVEPDSNHNGNNSGNLVSTTISAAVPGRSCDSGNVPSTSTGIRSRGQSVAGNFQHLMYASEDYVRPSSGNQVSSSQQGNELNNRFQYVLAAATSIATKIDEESLTYLNQGQSYEIKLKKIGDISAYRGKILKSSIRIGFHERRLQYTEKEQMTQWEASRPGERLIEVDLPRSYGIADLVECATTKNLVEFQWDPTKEVGVHIKVNCISTEFTQKKHGGEKGVPFRIQVDTKLPNGPRLHAASCQIKVFKLKGADRKHKQDLQKSKNRKPQQTDQYQTSYAYTMLTEIPLESLPPSDTMSPINPSSPREPVSPSDSISSAPLPGFEAENDPESDTAASSSEMSSSPTEPLNPWDLAENYTPDQVANWLHCCHFDGLLNIFSGYWGYELMQLTQGQIVELCGQVDGIRLYNSVHIQPQRIFRFAMDADPQRRFHVIKMFRFSVEYLRIQLMKEFNFAQDLVQSIILEDPAGTQTIITDNSLSVIPDWSLLMIMRDPTGHQDLCIKPHTS